MKTILKLAELYQSGNCNFSKLKLSNNPKITQIGAINLSKSLQLSPNKGSIKSLEFHNLTLGTNGAKYILEIFQSYHRNYNKLQEPMQPGYRSDHKRKSHLSF